MSLHYIKQCIHGTLVEQCRCWGQRTVTIVPCPPECPVAEKKAHSMDKAIFQDLMSKPDGRSRELHALAIIMLIMTSACASVGVRTIGHQPIKIIIGAEPSPTPCATPGGAK